MAGLQVDGTLYTLYVHCPKCGSNINVMKGGASGAFAASGVGGKYLQHVCSARGATMRPPKTASSEAADMWAL
jgi:hypothetical protein